MARQKHVIYNGVIAISRFKNKRTVVKWCDKCKAFEIGILNCFPKEFKDERLASSTVVRDRVHIVNMKLSDETMDSIINAVIQLRKMKKV
jgi:hypothetical protein